MESTSSPVQVDSEGLQRGAKAICCRAMLTRRSTSSVPQKRNASAKDGPFRHAIDEDAGINIQARGGLHVCAPHGLHGRTEGRQTGHVHLIGWLCGAQTLGGGHLGPTGEGHRKQHRNQPCASSQLLLMCQLPKIRVESWMNLDITQQTFSSDVLHVL